MKKSKCSFRSKGLWAVILCLVGAVSCWAQLSQGGNETMTKDLFGGSGGSPLQGGNETVAISMGETAAGYTLSSGTDTLQSGYLAGWWGTGQDLQLLSSQVGTTAIYSGGFQVGVPLQAAVQLNFSDQLQSSTLAQGITVSVLLDHMGQTQNTQVSVQFNYNPASSTVILTPQGNWVGDTLYDVAIVPGLLSLDGFTVANPIHVQFITALDPNQENVVLNPLPLLPGGGAPSPSVGSSGALLMDIPTEALAGFSVVLVSQDPLNSPIRVDPQIIRDANQKSMAALGSYGVPIAITEIDGYNLQGQLLNSLSRSAAMTLAYSASNGLVNGTAVIRPQTLAIWTLDETHHLWVKLPGSQLSAGPQSVTAQMPGFSVLALMGGVDGTTSDTIVFPIPWRPHGPNAGSGPGQTGTEQGGMTFSNLPSECSIKIYTLSGELVRTLNHSDTAGHIAQETWDGNTSGGEHAASGVYLWRVESSVDGTNGKLMIIR